MTLNILLLFTLLFGINIIYFILFWIIIRWLKKVKSESKTKIGLKESIKWIKLVRSNIEFIFYLEERVRENERKCKDLKQKIEKLEMWTSYRGI